MDPCVIPMDLTFRESIIPRRRNATEIILRWSWASRIHFCDLVRGIGNLDGQAMAYRV